MELKNYSEECLKCKCRTCRRTYKLNKNLSACNTWCDKNCKGNEMALKVYVDEICSDYILVEN